MTNNKKFINYNKQINKLILFMIKNVLKDVAAHGLRGGHHFYIKILTAHPNLIVQDSAGNIDEEILRKYDTDMTIVLQNFFQDLKVEDDHFSVILTFNSLPKTLIVPFDAILTFHDPFANFAVHLDQEKYEEDDDDESMEFEEYEGYSLYDDENDEIAKFLEYDFNVYRTSSTEKVIYLDDVKKNLKKF